MTCATVVTTENVIQTVVSESVNQNVISNTVVTSLSGNLSAVDDGTYINFNVAGTTYFRIVKATGNIELSGGVDTDVPF